MLHGRRLPVFLFVAVLVLSFATLDLLGQAKDDKKGDDKKGDSSKDPTKVTLAWKFEKNKTFYQTMKTTTTQTMKVMNNDVTQKQEQTFYFSWTPTEQKPDGSWIIEQKILGVKMTIDIGGSPINYDSTSAAANNASNPLSEFFKALVGSSFKLTLDPKTLKVTAIEGRTVFVKKLFEANKQMQPLLEKILSEDALKEMAEPTFAVVSNGNVQKGDHWEKSTKLDMGPIGTYQNKYTYTYEGSDDKKKLDKIDVKTQLTYSPPEKTEGVGGLPFKIKSADLKSKNANGTIYFDRDKGRVANTEMSLDLEGSLEIEIGGQPTKVELKQQQKTEVSTSDTNPVEPASKSTK